MLKSLAFVLGVFFIPTLAIAAEDIGGQTVVKQATLTLPNPTGRDRPNTYIQALLLKAMELQGIALSFDYYQLPSNQIRLNKLLDDGTTIDIAWLPADSKRLTMLDYIPIPLYQGLHGRRLLLIRANQQALFSEVNSLVDLSKMIALQQRSWSDYQILIDNGLRVNGELNYSAMLKALSQGIGDYFPRSALTIYAEVYRANDANISIENDLVLEYPTYTLLFMSQKQPELMKELKQGFQKMMQTGQYEAIFREFYQNKLDELNLSGRKVLSLQNKELSAEFNEELSRNLLF